MGNTERDQADELFADERAIEQALQRAFHKVLERHRQAGVPVVLWEDGKIVRRSPEEISLPNGAAKETDQTSP
jgi:hypothetical protein